MEGNVNYQMGNLLVYYTIHNIPLAVYLPHSLIMSRNRAWLSLSNDAVLTEYIWISWFPWLSFFWVLEIRWDYDYDISSRGQSSHVLWSSGLWIGRAQNLCEMCGAIVWEMWLVCALDPSGQTKGQLCLPTGYSNLQKRHVVCIPSVCSSFSMEFSTTSFQARSSFCNSFCKRLKAYLFQLLLLLRWIHE